MSSAGYQELVYAYLNDSYRKLGPTTELVGNIKVIWSMASAIMADASSIARSSSAPELD